MALGSHAIVSANLGVQHAVFAPVHGPVVGMREP
jgi:hypothetical protein